MNEKEKGIIKMVGINLETILLNKLGIPERKINEAVGDKTGFKYGIIYNWIKGKKAIPIYKLIKIFHLFNFSDTEILSLFKDSAADGGHKKELKQPELVKIPEPEPTQKYYGIIKKAYDMQDNNPEIKGKLSGVLTLIESIESDIRKINSQKKEKTGESKR